METATACKQCGAPYPPPYSKAGQAKARQRRAGGAKPPAPAAPQAADRRRHALLAVGVEHTLTVGHVFVAGRGEDCTLTIPSKRVSRKHAHVYWRSGLPVIKNLSSVNQTKVNGRSVQEHELRDGDTVQIGPYQMTYRFLRPGQESGVEPIDKQALTVASEAEPLAGNLNQFSLFEILGSYEQQAKTGTISISSDDGDGQIVLNAGSFVRASFENTTGEDAVFAMLALEDGLFTITQGTQKAAPMKIMRTFDYTATGAGGGGKRDLKRTKIAQLLKRAKQRQERSAQPAPRRPGRGRPPAGRRRGPPLRGAAVRRPRPR